MKIKFFMAMGLAVMLAAGSAFAGTATFSGENGDVDTDLPLPAVQSECSYTIPADRTVRISTALSEYPLFSLGAQTYTLEIVDNTVADSAIKIELNIISGTEVGSLGLLSAVLTPESVSLTWEGALAGSAVSLVSQAVAEVTTIQLQVTATTIELFYHDGSDFVSVGGGPLNLISINGSEDLTPHRQDVRLVTVGSSFVVNQFDWEGTVDDTNQTGTPCDVAPVPDVLGMDRTTAETTLTDAGFLVEVEYDGNFESPDFGKVISQDPEGETISSSNSVKIVIAGVDVENDSDNDGISDDWEIEHFGDIAAYGTWGDPDGDGFWNIREFYNDTDPNNPESRVPVMNYLGLALLALIMGAVGVTFVFRKVRA